MPYLKSHELLLAMRNEPEGEEGESGFLIENPVRDLLNREINFDEKYSGKSLVGTPHLRRDCRPQRHWQIDGSHPNGDPGGGRLTGFRDGDCSPFAA